MLTAKRSPFYLGLRIKKGLPEDVMNFVYERIKSLLLGKN